MTGVEEGKGGGGENNDSNTTNNTVQHQNGTIEKAPVVAGTNMETLPRPGKQSDPSTAFLRAARAGQLEKVLEFLESGVDINASNTNGLNALHLAAKDGHLEIVRELLTRGATVDAATKKGNTALHIASLAGQEEVVQLLVQRGASVNAQSQNGFTPLYMAAQENHDSVVKFLLGKGANQTLATEDGFTPLAVAMQQGHDKVVAVLLESDTRGKVRLPALHIAAKKDDCKAAALLLQNDHNPDIMSKSGFTPLHIAAHYGNDRIASLLYDKGADVNFAAKHNITPMHVAAKWGKIKMVNLLMSKGANIAAKTRDGLTPLHCAARAGHHEVVDILIEKGAPIGSKTKNGLAPLHMASQGDHVDAARILLYHRAPVDEVTVDYLTALHVAAHCGHVRVAKLLLDRNADPNARALNGFTPLHIACKKNRIKVVELLLKHKASIEATTESGLTPLHVASFMGCMNIVIYLLQNEASPDIPTVRGETPLHLAARANQTDIIRILLRNGAQVDARAREEQTPLHVASRLGNVDIVMLLRQHGADVDATTKDLYTPLHIAAKEGQEEVASVLLENGASLTATTKKGFTPLHLAAKYGNMNVARLLLQKNAPVDAQGKNGVTPLHVASHYDHQNVALLLLDKGASPHAMAKNGHTPLHIAARKNQMDIATTLLEYGAKANAESKAGFTPLHLSSQEGHTDMSTLLIEHKADTNHRAKNGLTPLHLCAQEDKTNVATILVKNGAQVDAITKAGYTPLHVAAHFGQAAMVRFLLRAGAVVDSSTGAGYTPLHQAAQQGHTLVINLLLESKAKPNAITNNGQTALAIAQKLGYISVVETLKVVTETIITTTQTITIEEKYKVQAPESMQETFMSDSEDEGGEDPMLSDQQQYRYMTVDDMKSMGDDSMRINVTDDERDNRHSGGAIVTDTITKDHYQRSNAANLKPDNVDIHRHPVHVGFLVSFLVDARGGAMRGCRHSGVRVIVPPRKAAMPMRVTCRYLKRDKLTNPPPLMEGEALASRILELGPVGAKFLGPVIIEVPHFASLRGKEREIVILRSDNGETWREHTLEASEEAVQDVLNESFEGEELSQLEDLQTSRIVRILTADFPHYFAVVSRIRQEVHAVGPEGGTVSSSAVAQVQAVFPSAALTKKIRVGLQAHPIPAELVAKLLGNRVAVSPIVTVEPRRRKFHKPITLTIPVPQAANKGMINQYSGDAPTLRLLCSITGGQSRAVWEDVTGSTPLTFVKDCVSFTTTVSARFWLMDCRNITEATRMATELYTHATHVPFMAKFVVFAKRVDPLEARLRVFCMTDDKEDKTLEHQEHFTEVAKSRDVEVLEGKTQYMEFAGNLVPVMKSGEQLQLPFRAFKENRVPFTARVKDPDAVDMVGRIMFMSELKVAKGEPPQTPICTLNILLPEKISPETGHSELDLLELSKNYSFLRDGGISRPDTIHRATIRLTDIANLLDRDWEKLAEELNISPVDVDKIKREHPGKPALQAAAMFKLWQSNGNKATGNTLEKALNKIGREDIVKKCIFNVELVTDDVEKAVARVRLDQPGFDSLKEELGPSRDSSLRRDGSLANQKLDFDYDEPDHMRDSESVENLSNIGSVPHKRTKQQHITITNGTVFNGTSTPIKDKYACEEKDIGDDMAEFLEHKCHVSDTMTKKTRDEADDDNKNRQRVYKDANQLVSGVVQDAEKEKEGLLGVNRDAGKEAEGAIGHDNNESLIRNIESVMLKNVSDRGGESVEPLIIKERRIIDDPRGGKVISKTIVTTTKGHPDSASIVTKTTTIRETLTPGQTHFFGANDPVIGPITLPEQSPLVENIGETVMTKTIIETGPIVEEKTITINSTNDKPKVQTVAFDTNVPTDRTKVEAKDITGVVIDPDTMSAHDKSITIKEKLSEEIKEVADKVSKPVNIKSTSTGKVGGTKKIVDSKPDKNVKKTEEDSKKSAYDGIYNVPSEQTKEDGKRKGSIFSGIFKSPKSKKGKSRDSQETSFDSGDEEMKITTREVSDDTRKISDQLTFPISPVYPEFDSTKLIAIIPIKLPEQEPLRDPIWATADFLYDSRRSAEAFIPESNVKQIVELKSSESGGPVTNITKLKDKKSESEAVSEELEDHEEKHGFFTSLFKGAKKTENELNVTGQDLKESTNTTKNNVMTKVEDIKEISENGVKDNTKSVKKVVTEKAQKLEKSIDKTNDKGTTIVLDSKQAVASVKSDIENSAEEVEEKSGGFFGIFKSPKSKDKRRSTSKDVSFDSGDEEVRVATAAFLDDTKRASDRMLEPNISAPQSQKQNESQVEKFITTIITVDSDVPKDKLKGTSYDIKERSQKSEIPATTITSKTITEIKLIDKSNDASQTLPLSGTKPEVQISSNGAEKLEKNEKRKSSDLEDSADEAKQRGNGFFGMFKSPKLKSKKKNRSRDRSTSKEPSFDSGDEELRQATSKFLEDTRKTAEITGSFDTHKRKSLRDSVRDETTSSSPVQNENKDVLINETHLDTKTKDQDKGGIFGIFKSPKRVIRSRSKSKEKGSSVEKSFDSGDEELRQATSKFLEDTRQAAEITESFDTPRRKSLKDSIQEKTTLSSTQMGNKDISTSGIRPEEKAKDQDKGGIFGIFKSPKSNVRSRSKSKEKSPSAEISIDHGNEELKIATAKFLDDTKNVSAIMEEYPYPSAPLASRYEKTSDTTDEKQKEKDEKSERIGEKSGFLSGIFKGAKHAVEEVTEDVKEFWDETKEDAKEEQEKAKLVSNEVAKNLKHLKNETTENIIMMKDNADEKISDTEDKVLNTEKMIENKARDGIIKINNNTVEVMKTLDDQTQKLTKVIDDSVTSRVEGVQKNLIAIEDEVVKAKEVATDEIGKDAQFLKDKVIGTGDAVANTTEEIKDKAEKEAKKVKDRSKGFFSGIFKGTKHATDEASEDVKKIVDDVKKEIEKDKENIERVTEDTTDHVTSSAKIVKDKVVKKVIDGRDELHEQVGATRDAFVDAAKTTGEKITDIVVNTDNTKATKAKIEQETKGIKDKAQESKENIVQGVSEAVQVVDRKTHEIKEKLDKTEDEITKKTIDDYKDVKEKINDEAKELVNILDATKHKTDKETKKTKEKGKGLFSGIFKGAKHATDKVVEDVKDFVDETKKEAQEEEEHARRATEVGIQTAKNVKDEVTTDIKKGVDKITDNTKKAQNETLGNLEAGKDVIIDTINTTSVVISDAATTTFDTVKEIKKKGDDNVETTKKAIDTEMENDARYVENKLKDATESVVDSVETAKTTMKEQVQTLKEKVQDSKEEIVEDTSKAIEEIDTKIREATKIADESIGTMGKNIKKNITTIEKKVDDGEKIMIDSVEAGKHKAEKEGKKVKEKTKSFFSGFFKGSKHSIEDSVDDAKDFLQKIQQETSNEKELRMNEAEEKLFADKSEITDSIKVIGETVSQPTTKTIEDIKSITKNIDDDMKKSGDEVEKQIEESDKIVDEKISKKTDILPSVDSSKDAIDKETKKGKAKMGGFFSGIFKGAKQTIDGVSDDAKDVADKIEKGVEKTTRLDISDKVTEDIKDSKVKAATDSDFAKDNIPKQLSEFAKDVEDTNEEVSTIVNVKEVIESTSTTIIDASTKPVEVMKETMSKVGKDFQQVNKKIAEEEKTLKDKICDTNARVADVTEETAEEIKNKIQEIGKNINETGKKVEVELKEDIKMVKDKVSDGAKIVVDSTEVTKHKAEKEVKKAKETGKGFFSGILKGVKHAADEITEDVKDFVDETKKEAEQEEERAKRVVEEATKSIKDTKDKVATEIKTEAQRIGENIEKSKEQSAEKLNAGKDAIVDAVKKTGTDISVTTNKTVQATKNIAKKVDEGIQKTGDTIEEKIKKDTKVMTDEMERTVDSVVDNAKGMKTKVDEEAQDLKTKAHETAEKIFKDTTTVVGTVNEKAHELTKKIDKTKDQTIENVEKDIEVVKQNINDEAKLLLDTADTAKHKAEKGAKKAKEKGKGLFSGIFKGAKHATDKVTEDVKDFVEETKKEAQEEAQAIKNATDKATNNIKKDMDKITDDAVKVKDKSLDNIEAGKNMASNVAKTTSTIISDVATKTTDTVKDTAKKISQDGKEVKDTLVVEINKDAEFVSNKLTDVVKGAKHTVDEVSEEVKEFWDETKKEAKEEENHARHTSDKLEKVKIVEITAPENQTKKTRDKENGMFFGILKGMKQKSNEVTEDIEDFLDEARHEASEEITRVQKSAEQLAKSIKDDIHSDEVKASQEIFAVSSDITDGKILVKSGMKDELNADECAVVDVIKVGEKKIIQEADKPTKATNEILHEEEKNIEQAKKIVDNSKKVVKSSEDSVKAGKQKTQKEVKKAKEKGSGFLSSIMKGAKHAVEEVSEDVKEFWDDTKEQAKEEEEKAKRALEGTSKASEDIENELKRKVSEKVSDAAIDVAEKTKTMIQQTEKNIVDGKNIFEETPQIAEKKIIEDTEKIMKMSEDITMNIKDDINKVGSDIGDKIKKDTGVMNDKITSATETTIETIEIANDKMNKEIKKDKDASSSMFFGILKGSKHTSGEIKNEIEKTLNDTEQGAKKKIKQTKQTGATVSKPIENFSDKTVVDVKAKDEKVKGILSETTVDNVQTVEKQVEKAKEKSGGFFSGIMKGAKQAVDEVSEEVKEFWDETKEEAKEEQERTRREVEKTPMPLQDDKTVSDLLEDEEVIRQQMMADLEQTVQHSADNATFYTEIPLKSPNSGNIKESRESESESTLLKVDSDRSTPICSTNTKSGKEKPKRVISGLVKSAKSASHKIIKEVDHATESIKDATEKFWEDTKQDASESNVSGSYDISSPLRDADSLITHGEVSDVKLELFELLDDKSAREKNPKDSESKVKSVSRIPQKISPTKELKDTKEIREVRVVKIEGGTSSKSVDKRDTDDDDDDDDDVAIKLGHLEPRARQSVTTVITKSVRTAAAIPPPSPDEFGDISIKDVMEEATKRAQIIANQTSTTDKSESDFLQHSEPSYIETTTTEYDPETNERITRTTRTITTSGSMSGTSGSGELRQSMQNIVDQFIAEERRAQ